MCVCVFAARPTESQCCDNVDNASCDTRRYQATNQPSNPSSASHSDSVDLPV